MRTVDADGLLSRNDLAGVLLQVWSAYLAFGSFGPLRLDSDPDHTDGPGRADGPDRADGPARADGPHRTDGLAAATVPMSGAFVGRLSLATSTAGAARIASLMLELDGSAVDDHDLRDAIGEFTNILAGNVKALLPQPTASGLPRVRLEPTGDVRAATDGNPTREVSASWGSEPVRIGVYQEIHRR